MAETKTPEPGKPLTKDQFVKVQDGSGNVLPDPVPRHWIGTDLLAPDVKEASRSRQGDSGSTD